MVDKRAEPGR